MNKQVGSVEKHPKRNPGDPSTWIAYYASLKHRGLSDYTRKGHYHILNRFGAWLITQGHLRMHPLADVKPPKLPKDREPKAIFREHIRAMLKAADDIRDRAILIFFRDTGCRATEAVTLKWGDLVLDEGQGTVPGKGKKDRKIFLKPVTRRIMKLYRETVPHKKTDSVWRSKKGPMTYDGLYKVFKRLAEKAGLGDENFNPHAWRHAFGRDTTQAGLPTVQLQDLLGHASIEVTKIYTQFNSEELQEAHDRYSPVDDDLDSLLDLEGDASDSTDEEEE